jgi:hypothetical protein
LLPVPAPRTQEADPIYAVAKGENNHWNLARG